MKTYSEWSVKIALTSSCNYSCFYCNDSLIQNKNECLSFDEVAIFLEAARKLGITREVHWTGGECTLTELGRYMKFAYELGFRRQAITSNGLLLDKFIDVFPKYGLERANISIDSLNPLKYQEITGFDGLDKVLSNSEKLLKNNIKVKFNMVLMRSNIDELIDFIEYTKTRNIILKLHELWNYGNVEAYRKEHVDLIGIKILLAKLGYSLIDIPVDIPTIHYLAKDNHQIGLLSAPSRNKCDSRFCRQIKLYADGRTCEGCRIDGHANVESILSSLMQLRKSNDIYLGDVDNETEI